MHPFHVRLQGLFGSFVQRLATVDTTQTITLPAAARVGAAQIRMQVSREFDKENLRLRVEARIGQGAAFVHEGIARMIDSMDFLVNEVFAPSFPAAQYSSRSSGNWSARLETLTTAPTVLTSAIASGTVVLAQGFHHVRESLAATLPGIDLQTDNESNQVAAQYAAVDEYEYPVERY
jgi:hypothetical protein